MYHIVYVLVDLLLRRFAARYNSIGFLLVLLSEFEVHVVKADDFFVGAQFEITDPTVQYGVDLSTKLLPQYLKDLGYKTHAVGQVGLTITRNCQLGS